MHRRNRRVHKQSLRLWKSSPMSTCELRLHCAWRITQCSTFCILHCLISRLALTKPSPNTTMSSTTQRSHDSQALSAASGSTSTGTDTEVERIVTRDLPMSRLGYLKTHSIPGISPKHPRSRYVPAVLFLSKADALQYIGKYPVMLILRTSRLGWAYQYRLAPSLTLACCVLPLPV